MKTTHPYDILNLKIAQLKQQQQEELTDLKSEVRYAFGNITPSKILHQGIDEIFKPANSKKIIITSAIGLIGNYLEKRFLGSKKDNSIFPAFVNLAQLALTGYFSKKGNDQ
ncbi:hypothetical protein ABGT15_13280 [Flavobacterium enshiense]|uniref:hypothetical protein n=1 Tax=Flavobacterium enshiense TaxID=1341165 RepID=UPI00345CC4B9